MWVEICQSVSWSELMCDVNQVWSLRCDDDLPTLVTTIQSNKRCTMRKVENILLEWVQISSKIKQLVWFKQFVVAYQSNVKSQKKVFWIVPWCNMAHSHLNSHLEPLSGKLGQWFTTDPTSSSLDSAHEKKRGGTNFSSNRRPYMRLPDQWA